MSASSSTELPRHAVGIVAGRAAGKTTYLAALHHALAFQPEDVGFYIEAPPSQSRKLIGEFSILSGHKWIPPTEARVTTWNFTLGVMSGARGWEACRFDYYDYGGELLEEDRPTTELQAKDIGEKLKGCQAIIALLDGQKISNFITGEDEDERNKFISLDLRNISQAIFPAIRYGDLRSLQFCITKWDFVEKTGQPLDAIKGLLLSIGHFAELIRMVRNNRSRIEQQQRDAKPGTKINTLPLMRLIPVSAVGFNFVKGFSRQQGMIINETAQPEPWNVAAPLASAFVDIMRAELDALKNRRSSAEGQVYSPDKKTLWQRLLASSAETILPYIPRDWVKNEGVLKAISNIVEDYVYTTNKADEARRHDFELKKEESLSKVRDKEAAFIHTVNMCLMLQQNLDAKFPGNVLE